MAIQSTPPTSSVVTSPIPRAATTPTAVQQSPTGTVGTTPPTSVQSASETAQITDPAAVDQALEEVRKAIGPVARDLRFSIDEDTGRTVVKIIDSSTDEVIKQIPTEEVLAIAKALDKLKGLLVRQEA
ncbi:flagellar protein FlaG [Aromatoleum evansii]|uniref:Flagellar protein FlaG n=1 Tax=Aromatoleum evansii TaxID=59406 RepID=A0ABZ1AGX8_AROEV|nr:flagellar protein FlaG [Aromatoleum evansii]